LNFWIRTTSNESTERIKCIRWENNQTSDTPVARVGTDNGAIFGPILVFAANGILREVAAKEEYPEEEQGE
jgi:hypothetical protein